MTIPPKKLFLLDMDGTLYLDDHLFEGTIPFLTKVKEIGARAVYLTNNSSRSVVAYVEKMNHLGIPCGAEDFVTSVDATIAYLKKHYAHDKLYVLGTKSFYSQLESAGLSLTTTVEDDIATLVMGFDTELTFQKLEDASILLKRNIGYIAANPDLVCPTAYGYVPDCGSVAEMLFHATGKTPIYMGKPESAMIDLALDRFQVTKAQTALIGDRVYTDILAGLRAGIDTIMVLSGEGTIEECNERNIHPTYIVNSISDVIPYLV